MHIIRLKKNAYIHERAGGRNKLNLLSVLQYFYAIVGKICRRPVISPGVTVFSDIVYAPLYFNQPIADVGPCYL